MCLILTKWQRTNETVFTKYRQTATPRCHPRTEKISRCDIFDVNFQKRVIGGAFLKARACERDLVASPRVILERSEESRGCINDGFAITVSKKCYFIPRKAAITYRRSLRRFAPRFRLGSLTLSSPKVRLRSG